MRESMISERKLPEAGPIIQPRDIVCWYVPIAQPPILRGEPGRSFPPSVAHSGFCWLMTRSPILPF